MKDTIVDTATLMKHFANQIKVPMNTEFVVIEGCNTKPQIFKITEQGIKEKRDNEFFDYQSPYVISKLQCGLAKAKLVNCTVDYLLDNDKTPNPTNHREEE